MGAFLEPSVHSHRRLFHLGCPNPTPTPPSPGSPNNHRAHPSWTATSSARRKPRTISDLVGCVELGQSTLIASARDDMLVGAVLTVRCYQRSVRRRSPGQRSSQRSSTG